MNNVIVTKIIITLSFILTFSWAINAQTTKDPHVLTLSEDGKQYIRFGMNAQLWARYGNMNPGSKINSEVQSDEFDIILRRLRLQAFGMLTEKVFFHIQLGQNNMGYQMNKNPYTAPIAIMDLLGEYHFSKKLHIGGGLCGWGAGTTRYSAQSSSGQLSLDAPIYQQNLNISSTFGNRNYSIYAKGHLGKFSYSTAITNPYLQTTNTVNAVYSTVSIKTPRPQFSGMLTYNFFDEESHTEAYDKATYLGTKKLFNIGVGYLHQSKSMWKLSKTTTADTTYNDMNVLGLDVFYDAPIGNKGAALTAYAAYNYANYGDNYTRLISTPNPASSGNGNGFIGVGTGHIFYTQIGYVFGHKNEEGNTKKAKTQIYGTTQFAILQALKTPMAMFEAGVNYYLIGTIYGPKLSLGYQNRSVSNQTYGKEIQQDSRKGMVVMQFQVHF